MGCNWRSRHYRAAYIAADANIASAQTLNRGEPGSKIPEPAVLSEAFIRKVSPAPGGATRQQGFPADPGLSTRLEKKCDFWRTEPDAVQGGECAAVRALQAGANAATRRFWKPKTHFFPVKYLAVTYFISVP
jgi:hypothetical protein